MSVFRNLSENLRIRCCCLWSEPAAFPLKFIWSKFAPTLNLWKTPLSNHELRFCITEIYLHVFKKISGFCSNPHSSERTSPCDSLSTILVAFLLKKSTRTSSQLLPNFSHDPLFDVFLTVHHSTDLFKLPT